MTIDPASTRNKLEASQEKTQPYVVDIGGLPLTVHPGVYSPLYFKGTEAFIQYMRVRGGERWLDMGTGIGAIGIHAAFRGAREVIGADINQLAVANARENVRDIELEKRMTVVESDLFERINGTFDTISFNQPLTSGVASSPVTMLERAVFDPGYNLLRRFLRESHAYLNPGGKIFIGSSPDVGDEDLLRKMIASEGYIPFVLGTIHKPSDQWQEPLRYRVLELQSK